MLAARHWARAPIGLRASIAAHTGEYPPTTILLVAAVGLVRAARDRIWLWFMVLNVLTMCWPRGTGQGQQLLSVLLSLRILVSVFL